MIDFRPLSKNDFPMLCEWLNQPHMRKFYQPVSISLEQVIHKFTTRVEGIEPTFSHIALMDGQAFGKIQSYKNLSYPDYAAEVGLTDGISIDLFIGDPACLKKGLGQQMMTEYLKSVALSLFPDERHCYICHDKTNLAALNCSKSVGFNHVRDVTENGILCELLVYDLT